MDRCDNLVFTGVLFAVAFTTFVVVHSQATAGPSRSLAVILFGLASGLFGSNLWDYFRRRRKGQP